MWLLAHGHELESRAHVFLAGDPTCQYGCFAFPEPPVALLLPGALAGLLFIRAATPREPTAAVLAAAAAFLATPL